VVHGVAGDGADVEEELGRDGGGRLAVVVSAEVDLGAELEFGAAVGGPVEAGARARRRREHDLEVERRALAELVAVGGDEVRSRRASAGRSGSPSRAKRAVIGAGRRTGDRDGGADERGRGAR
jgi:hypothetical protein